MTISSRRAFAVLAGVSAVAMASADFNVSIPETSGLSTAFRQAARTYLSYYTPAALSASSPATIYGVRFKLYNGELASWPPSNINFSSFKIVMGAPTAQLVTDGEFLSLTPTYNSYFSSMTTCYDAPLAIAAGSFVDNGTTSNPFGPDIIFSTPYAYAGGEMLLGLTHTGYGATPAQAFFAVGNFQNGVTDAISSSVNDPAFGTSPSGFSSPYIVEFITTPVPEPSTFAVAGFGLAALLLRRRNK